MPEPAGSVIDELGLGDVADLRRSVLASLGVLERQLAAIGRTDLVERLRTESERQSSETRAVVVFAGEPSQGKSLLVNALVSRPDLLPVDFDVSTGVHVAIHAGRPETATVFLGDDESGEPVPVERIADFVSVSRNPGNHLGVRFVDVVLDVPVLDAGLDLVDTPGVGGLDAAHGRMTLAVLSRADALVFVLDASGPLSAPELRFLAAAAERIDSVLVVLTKIDANPEWRTVLAENKLLLAREAPALADAPWVPVSGLLAIAGLTAGAQVGRVMTEESNLLAVERWLVDEVAGRRRRVRIRNAARLGLVCVTQLENWYDRVLVSLEDAQAAQDAQAELVAQQKHLEDLNKAAATWRAELHEDMSRSERALVNELATRSAGVRSRMEQDIAQHWQKGGHTEIRSRLDLELQAVEADLQVQLSELAAQAARRCASSLGVDEVELPSLAVSAVGRLTAVAGELGGIEQQAAGRIARQVVMGASSSFVNPYVGLVRLVMSLVNARYDLDASRRTQEQQEARRLLAEALGQWQRDFAFALGDAVRDTRKLLEAEFGDLVKQQIAAVAGHLRALTSMTDEQAKRVRQRVELLERREQMQAAAAQLRQLVGSTGGDGPVLR